MTHKMIRLPMLRAAFASELWQARKLRRAMSNEEFAAMRYGIESGLWGVQKRYNIVMTGEE